MKLKMCDIVSDTTHLSLETIQAVTGDKACIRHYAYILHDKDKNKDGTDATPHYHVFLRFEDTQDTKYVAKWFGIAENFVGKINGKWTDALLYLTHENAPSKFQYPETDVVSNYDWKKEKNAKLTSQSLKAREAEIVSLIANGTIKKYNYNEYITPVEYVRLNASIKAAMNYRADMLSHNHNRQLEVVYIVGGSGCGKSTYAKRLAEEKGLSCYVSSGSNDVLDDYGGQDCLILDDLRPSCLGLSDLLKLLDNNTSTSVKSRYKNKILECSLIIITTVKEIDEFFSKVFEHEDEPLKQLKRRCRTMIRLSADTIEISVYNDTSDRYDPVNTYSNPIAELYKTEPLTQAELTAKVEKDFCISGMEAYVPPAPVVSGDGFMEIVPDGEPPFK
ncbi:Rep family protein [Eisenbergiella tayi]|uniref:Rep family protein n=1 Tax=Eisenbergiella tayi TaxID=1432052 RepID=UPI001495473A|nr:Rep family protein [Eisenbergiella tayi]